ncbi:hypothetical protein OKW21_006137 [Catalinimonas alkaloidigena]|uniref:four helix bundle protein n=1 Tax=Catalinimonas alkaloidigena TaxID=1075417 RepID=UPI0024076C37|nr:four helix bundle protein [Catalinimonas alkaloidigena]MDF9800874.1 hypothetical protein [Catalinimonas alkaloidigena]
MQLTFDSNERKNPVQEKSFAFAMRIVRVYQHLVKEQKELVPSKQLISCGTSVGAKVEEGIGGISKKISGLSNPLPIKKHGRPSTG